MNLTISAPASPTAGLSVRIQSDKPITAADKNAVIGTLIREAMNLGMAGDEAIDFVLGAGTYKRLAGELYDALRAKSGG